MSRAQPRPSGRSTQTTPSRPVLLAIRPDAELRSSLRSARHLLCVVVDNLQQAEAAARGMWIDILLLPSEDPLTSQELQHLRRQPGGGSAVAIGIATQDRHFALPPGADFALRRPFDDAELARRVTFATASIPMPAGTIAPPVLPQARTRRPS